jgi:outer membrane receptor for ferrienterochelin and colicins
MDMNINRFIIVSAMLAFLSLSSSAQSQDEQKKLYATAESDYSMGRLDQAQAVLTTSLDKFKGNLRQGALHILSLCALAQDHEEEAERYAQKLMKDNPYYTPSTDDPQRFVDIIDRIKRGMTNTITTASSQEENLSEAPVPVTLITEEMIQNSGARNLKELLTAYVPGMTSVDCNDGINVAMRGVFSEGQEKILIMLNGHRLNSYATNTASPDYSIGLEKIKQIEVLRGPASSLYGDVALTAVVNIITKHGADIDGVQLKAGIGNYGQWKTSILFGKRYFDVDLMAWGNLTYAEGQNFYLSRDQTGMQTYGGNIKVGGMGEKPSYDMGVSFSWAGLTFLYNTRFSQLRSPYTASYTFLPYDRGSYPTYQGMRPSFANEYHHIDLSYAKNFTDRLFLGGTITYDMGNEVHYQVLSDSSISKLSQVLGTPSAYDAQLSHLKYVSRYLDGQEHNIGAQLKGDYTYISNEDHQGSISFGTQYSMFQMDDCRYSICGIYNNALSYTEKSEVSEIGKGKEYSFNAYMQIKHRWKNFILNSGIRYDSKKHYDSEVIRQFSPRVALIYVLPYLNVKLSYSKSFVDAPYFYRKINIVITSSSDANLNAEKLHSWQLSVASNNLLKGLNIEINGFYNRAVDMIYPNGLVHSNAGEGKNMGLEFDLGYKTNRFDARVVGEWQHVVSAEFFGRTLDKLYNIPEFSSSAVLAYSLLKNLKVHTQLDFYGKQLAYKYDMSTQGISDFDVPSRFLLNLGADYHISRFGFSLNVHNLLNKDYTQGGIATRQVQQQGLWYQFTASMKL